MRLDPVMTIGNLITLATLLIAGMTAWIKTRQKVDQLMSWRDQLELDMKTLTDRRSEDTRKLTEVIDRNTDTVIRVSTLLDSLERRVSRIESVLDARLMALIQEKKS